jgi:hypothetical protein
VAKKKKKGNGRQPMKTARLNLMISPALKKRMHDYSRRAGKSLTALITEHFVHLLEREKDLDVEQI